MAFPWWSYIERQMQQDKNCPWTLKISTTMEPNKCADEDGQLVLPENLPPVLNSWTPRTTPEFLVLMTWLKYQLYNCE